jgi:hypothetical protein
MIGLIVDTFEKFPSLNSVRYLKVSVVAFSRNWWWRLEN